MASLLKTPPVDYVQRALNQFDLRPYCFLTSLVMPCCSSAFSFNDYCPTVSSKPLGNLPVLYTSSHYASRNYVVPNLIKLPNCQYWIGPTPTSSIVNVNAMATDASGARAFYSCCNQNGQFNIPTGDPLYRSASNTVLFYESSQVKKRTGAGSLTPLGNEDVYVTDLQISGDGSTFFKLSGSTPSWYRWKTSAWESMNTNLAIGYTYDGQYACSANWSGSFLVVYAYSDATAPIWRSPQLLAKESDGFIPYLAMIGTVVFVALGKTIYSIGSNLYPYKLKTPTISVCTGIWTDASTIWVAAGNNMTYMSTDQGWTWIEQLGVSAVNRGLYTRPATLDIVKTDPIRFQDDVQYPLKLNNRGLLSSFDDDWQHAFELKNGEDDYTLIDCDTRYATSPNGLFLLDNNMEGDVVLYLNVWRSAQFSAWRSSNRSITCRGYDTYCELMQDDNCIIGIPPIGGGGDDGKDPGDSDPPFTPPPDTPKKSRPIGIIIGVGALGLLLLMAGIWFAATRNKKSPEVQIKK